MVGGDATGNGKEGEEHSSLQSPDRKNERLVPRNNNDDKDTVMLGEIMVPDIIETHIHTRPFTAELATEVLKSGVTSSIKNLQIGQNSA